jgi:hypothetical protein
MNALAKFDPSQAPWDVLELLALLNGKGQSYEIGRGGAPKVTGLDVAGALAGLPDHIQRYAYLLAGAALRPADTKRVGNVLKTKVRDDLVKSKTTPKTATLDKIAEGIARCALVQRLKAKGECTMCHGVGKLRADVRMVTCGKCDGTGRAVYTLKERVEIVGLRISAVAYAKTWVAFEERAMSYVYEWDELIRGNLKPLVSG